MTKIVPRLFIGSSSESLSDAEALAASLRPKIEAIVWPKIFSASDFTLEALGREAERADLAVLLFTPVDSLRIRDKNHQAVRDNVIFEFGMFAGRLGRRSAYYLIPHPIGKLHLPSDLSGLNAFTYDANVFAVDPAAAMSAAGIDIQRTVDQSIFGSDEQKTHTGRWHQTWEFVGSSNFDAANPSVAEVLHIDRRFRARFKSKRSTYIADGLVEGRMITGTWRDAAAGGVYYGAFQLAVVNDGRRLVGKWIGHREDLTDIASGPWTWERVR